MVEHLDASLIDWSRAQFALTAIYHWLFVPLTLGLGIIQAIMETVYYKTGNEFWKKTAQFWMKLFGINFAIGVATGLILEFEFGTNWSNYSFFVGDIFGAPLAIEGIVAFFMETTFIAVMYFGWDKVSKRFHLASTWLTVTGATISAFWILVANAWMQYPAGMAFNPDVMRNEMVDFWAVAFSPVAVNKFLHTVFSSWIIGGMFVVSISCWFLLKKRETKFALSSIKIGAIFGLIACVLSIYTGDGSAHQVSQKQPMKFAAMEGLYDGGKGVELVGFGVLNPKKEIGEHVLPNNPFIFKIAFPKFLSFLAERDFNAYVPGINNLLEGGYPTKDGSVALSVEEKMMRGKWAVQALSDYSQAKKNKDEEGLQSAKSALEKDFPYFGYAYLKNPAEAVPPVGLTFYAFHIMVVLGGFLLVLFALTLFSVCKKKLENQRWLQWIAYPSFLLAVLAGQAGWVVAEVGRQPWVIQDLMPASAAISKLSASAVQVTFFLFLVLFTVLLVAELSILIHAVKKGPQISEQ